MSERQHDASSTGWYAIELNGAFGYAGAHYQHPTQGGQCDKSSDTSWS